MAQESTSVAALIAAAQDGQSILFQPFNKAASEIQALIHNPADLAVSNATTAAINSGNTGTLQLSSLKTLDFSGVPAEGTRINITFTAQGAYNYQLEIYDSVSGTWAADPSGPLPTGSGSYSPGTPISINGWEITLTGTPSAGDEVTVGNAKDLGDGFKLNSGNASAFLDLRDASIFDNGTTLSDGFSAAMAVVGSRTQSAKYAAELSATVAENLTADRTAVSGVNLDEEAARLLQYQQSYQASAKVIQIAQSLFDNVLNAVNS